MKGLHMLRTPVVTALPATIGVRVPIERLQCQHWAHLAATAQHDAGWHQIIWLRDTPTGRRFILANGTVADSDHGDRVWMLPASAMSAYLSEGALPWTR